MADPQGQHQCLSAIKPWREAAWQELVTQLLENSPQGAGAPWRHAALGRAHSLTCTSWWAQRYSMGVQPMTCLKRRQK